MNQNNERLVFELNRLLSYEDADLVAEIRRVAGVVGERPLTAAEFDKHAKVHSSTVRKRFGGWAEALAAAGMRERYGGRPVSEKMKTQAAKGMLNGEIIAEMQQVALRLGKTVLTMEELNRESALINAKVVKERFGSWKNGLDGAGLILSHLGRRYTDDEYFENMLLVWTHYGRPPRYREMDKPPSRIGKAAYEHKWGTWSRARLAFVERVNSDIAQPSVQSPHIGPPPPAASTTPNPPNYDARRELKLGLRYAILSRDRFRCVACGASPATDLGCQLHVDHVIPVARGGKSEIQNLRTLCLQCNLGKGTRLEPIGPVH